MLSTNLILIYFEDRRNANNFHGLAWTEKVTRCSRFTFLPEPAISQRRPLKRLYVANINATSLTSQYVTPKYNLKRSRLTKRNLHPFFRFDYHSVHVLLAPNCELWRLQTPITAAYINTVTAKRKHNITLPTTHPGLQAIRFWALCMWEEWSGRFEGRRGSQ